MSKYVSMYLKPALHFAESVSGDTINPKVTEKQIVEGSTVNLTCKYDGNIYNIQWYRQYPQSKPEFILSITEDGTVFNAPTPFPRHSSYIQKKDKHVHLQISSAQVTDSALFYCALKPTVTVKQYNTVQKPPSNHNMNYSCKPHPQSFFKAT